MKMTPREAHSLLKQHKTRPEGFQLGRMWDQAKQVVAEEREQKRAEKELEAQKQHQEAQQQDWDRLPFYLKWWYGAQGWFMEGWYFGIPRGIYAIVAIVLLVVVGRAAKNFSPSFPTFGQSAGQAPAAGNPDALGGASSNPKSGSPDALAGGTPQAAATLSILSTPTLNPPNIVDCTVATCPDADPYKVDYEGSNGPKGSGTLRKSCTTGDTILGAVPKSTIVWVIRTTIKHPGSYCETINGTKECRAGMIKPSKGLEFAKNGGCISFTALVPFKP